MESKGKCVFGIRARVAAFWGVAVIALFVVLICQALHSDKTDRLSDTVIDMSVTDYEDEPEKIPITGSTEQEENTGKDPMSDNHEESDDQTANVIKESPGENSENRDIPRVNFLKQNEDYEVIPDKYNCGAKGNLTKVGISDTVNGVKLKESGGINSFDFCYINKSIEGETYFTDYDFSEHIVAVYNADAIDREITLVFDNCKFSTFRSLANLRNIRLVFRNCTFNSFFGCCADFEHCKFGDSYTDGIVPFHDVFVKDCYISNFSSRDEKGTGVHTDGTQLYGKEGMDVKNIRYEHCRFEVPCIPGTNEINACIMLQMEYSNGIDISFNNCICNGGGYTLYALSKDKGFKYYENVSISNIAVGQSRKYGSLYPVVSEGVEISNIYDIDSLYVASVWKENGKTHMSVTNDTLQLRKLVVNADGVTYTYDIPPGKGGEKDHYDRFEDYPFDIDICIDSDCRYIVCFDQTSGEDKQIRFVTWDGSDSISIPCEE